MTNLATSQQPNGAVAAISKPSAVHLARLSERAPGEVGEVKVSHALEVAACAKLSSRRIPITTTLSTGLSRIRHATVVCKAIVVQTSLPLQPYIPRPLNSR